MVDGALSPTEGVERDLDVCAILDKRVVDVAALGLFEVEEAGASRPVPDDKLSVRLGKIEASLSRLGNARVEYRPSTQGTFPSWRSLARTYSSLGGQRNPASLHRRRRGRTPCRGRAKPAE